MGYQGVNKKKNLQIMEGEEKGKGNPRRKIDNLLICSDGVGEGKGRNVDHL